MDIKINKFKRKLQKNKATDAELFKVHGLLEYGYPPNASAIAYDPKLSLLALGTSSGEVRIYGRSGVQLVAKHAKPVHIFQLVFIPNQGRIISQGIEGESSVISLFETNSKNGKEVLELVKTIPVQKKVTTCSLSPKNEFLLIGTEVGDVYKLNLEKFAEFEEDVIHLDVAMQNVPDDFKVNPGGVEAIELHPTEENLVLIGYSKGLLVLWDLVDNIPQGTFYTSCKSLESVTWYKDASRFLSSHEDGSYFIWSKDPEKQYSGGPQQIFPFGEEESTKKIGKIQVLLSKSEEFIIFSGGLPRDTYAETNSVTVIKGGNQVNFELSSKVVDFICLPEISESSEENSEQSSELPSALFILTEDELVAIDLQTEANDEKSPLWPTFNKPYLNSASPSDLTCIYVYEDCDQSFVDKLRADGKSVNLENSARPWPVTGGNVTESSGKVSVLVTGHYDGAVRFYDVNGGRFELLYTLNLGDYFKSEDLEDQDQTDAEPLGDLKLRKVGSDFQACVDDSRFAICKLYICPKTNSIVIGSHSGQVVVFENDAESNMEVFELKIVDESAFKWKGSHPLTVKSEIASFPVGFNVNTVIQCEPPAPVTALVVNTQWGVLAVGTNHGFGVFDTKNRKSLLVKSTLVENDEAASGQKLSKAKSLREGIRNSFRRIKKKPAETPAKPAEAPAKPAEAASPAKPGEKPAEEPAKPAEEEPKPEAAEVEKPTEETQEEKKEEVEGESKPEEAAATEQPKAEDSAPAEAGPSSSGDAVEDVAKTDEEKLKEKEQIAQSAQQPSTSAEDRGNDRVVVAKSEQDKTLQSTVRTLSFADTFLRNNRDHSPSLWIGTHAGTIYAYLIEIPENREQDLKLALAKEIRLHHRAPVVFMSVLDHSGFPIPDSAAVAAGKQNAADMSGHHHLLVCSEEQVKLFTLPQLKGKYKEKLTAIEGVKVRKVSTLKQRHEDVTHNFLACMLNEGQVSIFSLPALFCQYKEKMVAKDNKIATLYTEFVSDGAAYSLESTNLIRHFGLAKDLAAPVVAVELPEGARPVAVVPEPEPEKVEGKPAEEEPPLEPSAEEQEGPAPSGGEMPTVEEEAKAMIDDAEATKDQEFQEQIQNELSPENPEITTTTTTTYRAIESRTILSSDDGENVAKIITTTRDTTLALDGELVTQKTQQKEEFELSPTEENAPEENAEFQNEDSPKITEVEENAPEEADKGINSSEEMLAAAEPDADASIVRTATLTSEKSDEGAVDAKLDDDQITHHIGADDAAPAEEAPKEEEGFTGVCYGGSSGRLYSPLAVDQDEEKAAAAEEEKPEDGVTGECYGGSQGNLYSPLAKESEGASSPPPVESEQAEEAESSEQPADAPEPLVNGDSVETQGPNENQEPSESTESPMINGQSVENGEPASPTGDSGDIAAPVKQVEGSELAAAGDVEA